MSRYIAFLRALNVGGHVVKMDRLRALFEELGFANVTTFIASGNVLFDSASRSVAALERKIERHLEPALGYEVETFIRTPAELASIAAYRPAKTFKRGIKPKALYIGFLKQPPPSDSLERLSALCSDVDHFHVNGRELYWSAASESLTQSRVTGPQLAKALGMLTTTRNIRTVERLVAL